MSVRREGASEPGGESMDASTMAVSMRPRRSSGMAVRMKNGKISSGRGADAQVDQQRDQSPDGRERERPLALSPRLHREQPLHQVVVGAEPGGRAGQPGA